MGAHTDTLLRYRPWRGELLGPVAAAVALARASLKLMFRRWQLWGLFALGLLVFMFFFYAQYLAVWIPTQLVSGETVRFGGIPVKVGDLTRLLERLNMSGTAHTFGNFIWFEGYVLVIVLALAGSVLVGNDFAHGSLPFYLSKPIGRWHYVLGKCLAIGGLVHLMTTVPAVLLWLQAGLLHDWQTYYWENRHLLLGILGYGMTLSVVLSLLVVATAVWLRRTVPLVMVWMGVFVLLRMLAAWLAAPEGLGFDERWRLIDLWNDLYLAGLWCLGEPLESVRPQPQPGFAYAWAALVAVCAVCLLYLRNRIQAVEIVS
jgi:ABC-2 type transport system permease protein